ncbi:MAG: hypothetical protein ACREGK_09585, partial [Geminicoccales bacterium]
MSLGVAVTTSVVLGLAASMAAGLGIAQEVDLACDANRAGTIGADASKQMRKAALRGRRWGCR